MIDAILHLYASYQAHMAERTGLPWEQLEAILKADQQFWVDRPGAKEMVEEFLAEDEYDA